jgi:hypothetical protein
MKLAGDYSRPISVRYVMITPFGWTQQDLSFDVPYLGLDPSKIGQVFWALWEFFVATATVRSTSLIYLMYVDHHGAPAPQLYAGLPLSGLQLGATGDRGHQAVVTLHSGEADDWAARRFFVPGMPRSWQADGLLTDTGWDGLMAWVQGVGLGGLGQLTGSEFQLLHSYFGAVDVTPENLLGVAFRTVRYLRLHHHVAKVPDLSLGIWP